MNLIDISPQNAIQLMIPIAYMQNVWRIVPNAERVAISPLFQLSAFVPLLNFVAHDGEV